MKVHAHVAPISPTQVRKRLNEGRVATHPFRIVFAERHKHADAPHAVALLSPRHHRPRRRRTEPGNEISAPH
jgi:hypothetical protein